MKEATNFFKQCSQASVSPVEINLAETGTIILKYGNQVLYVVPIRSYTTRNGTLKDSTIRIFPKGGGIASKDTRFPKTSLTLKRTSPDGSPSLLDKLERTTCIELEPDFTSQKIQEALGNIDKEPYELTTEQRGDTDFLIILEIAKELKKREQEV